MYRKDMYIWKKSKPWNYDWDNPSMAEKKSPSAFTRNIFLIRTAHWDTTIPKYNVSTKVKFLTPLGQYQAACTGKRLQHLNLNFSKIYHSRLFRAEETSACIEASLTKVPVAITTLLDDSDPPPEPFIPSLEYIQEDCPIPEKRLNFAFNKFFNRPSSSATSDSYEIMVTHAAVIRYFMCKLLQIKPGAGKMLSLPHASITWVEIHGDGTVRIKRVGECGHILPDKVTV
ncbi:Serine/threonine-protein phosphatase PGAM5, mitochondrial, partial [Stegodyphus mimosarum]